MGAAQAGCRIEQPLVAAQASLTRAQAAALDPAEGGPASWLRPDSLWVTLVLADEDDCSAAEPDELLTDDVASSGCAERLERLSRVDVLAASLRELRPDAADLSLLAVVTGVPADRVDLAARREYDLEDSTGRSAYYGALLDDPRMALAPSAPGASEVPDDRVGLSPACTLGTLVGYPAPRLVEAAWRFGPQGVVQSICDPNAWQLVAHTIGRRLGSPER